MNDEAERIAHDAAERRQEVNRGERAKRIYEDSLFKDAIGAIKDRIWDQFSKSDIHDDRARLIARLELECLDNVLKEIRTHVETGKLAATQLPILQRTIDTITRRTRK